jgi:peptidoglycan/xylan/chitin deacetylase (PgdA/CDA1 family)
MHFQESQVEERIPPPEGSSQARLSTGGMEPERDLASASGIGSRRLHPFLKSVLRKSCALDLLSRATAQDRVEILLYHGFCPGSRRDQRFPKLMPIQQFEEHVRACARYSRPISLDQIFQPGASGVVITFDDGYANNFELAFPVLQKYQFPATVFLTSGFLDQSRPVWGDWLEFLVMTAPSCDSVFEWRDVQIALPLAHSAHRAGVVAGLARRLRILPIAEIHEFLHALEAHLHVCYHWDTMPSLLRPLKWHEVRTMRRSGLVSFGCHTVSHPVLSRCSAEAQTSEIFESKRRIEEELGEECNIFAYPYGKKRDYTEVTTQLVKRAGFELAVSAESGSTKPSACNPYELHRWGADLGVNELSFLVSGGPSVFGYLKEHGWR